MAKARKNSFDYLFPEKLKKICRNVRVKEICKKTNIQKSDFLELKNGKRYPTLNALQKIAKELNTTIVFLLTGSSVDVALKDLPLDAKDSFILWYYKWIHKKSSEITFTQIATYCSDSQYILKEFGNKRLCDITWNDVDNYLKAHCHLSRRTLRDHRTLIKQTYSFAKACKVYTYNPAETVSLPKNSAKAESTKIISPKTRSMIMSFEHNMQLAAVIMLLAGLRRGELLALTFGDINLVHGTITVNKVIEMKNGVPTLQHRAKSDAGIREVDMPEILIRFLTDYMLKHPEAQSDDLIISNSFGKPLTSKDFYRKWKNYIECLNLHYGNFRKSEIESVKSISELPLRIERFTSKQLRHTYATMLYLSGTDVLVAKEQLGHSKITTTLDFYCHLDKKYKKRNMNHFNKFLTENNFWA